MKASLFSLFTIILFSAGLWSNTDQVQVSADQAALRELPSQQSRVLLTVARGTRLKVAEKLADWYEVFTPDGKSKAFVHANLVRPLPAPAPRSSGEAPALVDKPNKPVLGKLLVNVSRANIRELPGTQSRILAGVEQGRELDFTGRSGNWYEVILPEGRGTGFISAGIVEELSVVDPDSRTVETAEKARTGKPEKEVKKSPAPAPAPPKKAPAGKKRPPAPGQGKIYLAGFYNLGLQEDSARAEYQAILYFETASFSTAYELPRANSFSAALGYHFSPALALEVGADISSRNINAQNSFAIPHPLWTNSPRSGEASFTGKLEEKSAYLNLVLVLRFSPLQLRLAAGPCYLMAKAGIIGDFSLSESAYPYETVNISPQQVENTQNVFAFNAAAALGYSISPNFSLLLQARYIGAQAEFSTGTDYPGLKINLGGLKLGGGLQISF